QLDAAGAPPWSHAGPGLTACQRSRAGQPLASLLEISPRIARGHVFLDGPDGEAARVESRGDLVPCERRRDRGAWTAAHRIRRDDRLQAGLAEGIGVDARAARLLAELHRHR